MEHINTRHDVIKTSDISPSMYLVEMLQNICENGQVASEK